MAESTFIVIGVVLSNSENLAARRNDIQKASTPPKKLSNDRTKPRDKPRIIQIIIEIIMP